MADEQQRFIFLRLSKSLPQLVESALQSPTTNVTRLILLLTKKRDLLILFYLRLLIHSIVHPRVHTSDSNLPLNYTL